MLSSSTPFEIVLENYKKTLSYLDNSKIDEHQALEILAARDALLTRLETETEIPLEMGQKIKELDTYLKQKSYEITLVIDLAEYRETLPISDKAWWWNLDTRESQHPWNRWDWFWKTIKLILLGVNFALIGTIVTKFLSGASGFLEILGVILSIFIS